MNKIIILHGWTYSVEKWQTFLDILEKKGFEITILRVPGLTSENDKVWRTEDYVNWLYEKIEKEKGKVVILGHSNGGRIALAFTNLFPERVERLILIDSAGIYHNELPIKIKRAVFKTLAKIGKKLTSSKTIKNLFYKLVRESDYKDLDENTKRTMINLISSDLKPILSKIQTPTLIIWGRNDKVIPLSDGLIMKSLIKNSKLEIIENAKHSPQFTHPNQVAEAIINNLAI